MTVEAPAAPSSNAAPAATPAPAGSESAPASGGAPSWAAEGGVNAFLTGATSDAPPSRPAPSTRMEPRTEAPPPAPAPASSQPEAPAPPAAAAETPQPATPANPAPAAPAPAKAEVLLAGRFKAALPGVDEDPGVKALAKAYESSGQEARRLLQVANETKGQVQSLEKTLAERQAEIEALKLDKQLGPEIVDPTPDELATWSPQKITEHSIAKFKREQLKEKLESQKKQTQESEKQVRESNSRQVLERIDHMTKSADEFPGFEDYMKEDESGRGPIADWVPLVPMLSGHPIAPLVLYLIAKGHEALQKDKASVKAAKESKTKAEELARASLPAAAGSGGGPGPQPEPSKPASEVDPDSDEGHNARLIGAHAWSKPLLPID